MANNNNNNNNKTGGSYGFINKIEIAERVNNSSNMANNEEVKYTFNERVMVRAWLTRLQKSIKDKNENEEKHAAAQISWILRGVAIEHNTKTANEIIATLGLEKYGWEQETDAAEFY